MSEPQAIIAYSLNILSSSELALFCFPSTLYPIDADPLFDIPWDLEEISLWPELPGYHASADPLQITRLLQLPFPVFPI
jgi:hypothetical protein